MIKRETIQKKLVLEAVRKLGCHATAEEIFAQITAEYPSISKGTVYRNLNSLSEDGEILRIEIPGAADHFDHNCRSHYHVVCVRCGNVFDVDMEPVASLTEQIHDTHGFDFLDCDIVFKGICPACQRLTASTEAAMS